MRHLNSARRSGVGLLRAMPYRVLCMVLPTLATACTVTAPAPVDLQRPQRPAMPGAEAGPASTINSLRAVVDAALVDAARRSGLAVAALKVVSADRVTWADGSLGCPEPGLLYTQALVSGYRVRIQAGGQTWDYHAGVRGAPRWCPPGRSLPPAAQDDRI